jgi:acetolactate synthase-1/3 small subunit
MATTKHTLVALVADKPGVFNRISSLFRRRGFNIESIAVGHSELPNISRVSIVVDGANTTVEQVRKQLDKLIDVVKVLDITSDDTVERELALIKVKANSVTRSEIMQIVDIFRAKIVDVSADSVTVEVTGDENKIESLVKLFRGFGIREIVRTGRIAVTRGGAGLAVKEEAQPAASRTKKKTA